MNLKRTLIETLPPGLKRLLAVPYDYYQTRRADRRFAAKELPSYDRRSDAPDHIVCVVVDAMRADHVDEATTPYLASVNYPCLLAAVGGSLRQGLPASTTRFADTTAVSAGSAVSTGGNSE
jgi:hypothetical protein